MPHFETLSVEARIVHLLAGALLTLIGAYVGGMHLVGVPPFITEAIAYVVHGCGIAPILAAVLGSES